MDRYMQYTYLSQWVLRKVEQYVPDCGNKTLHSTENSVTDEE